MKKITRYMSFIILTLLTSQAALAFNADDMEATDKFYILYTLVVQDFGGGPIMYVLAFGFCVLGVVMLIKQSWMIAVTCFIGSALLVNLEGILGSLGFLI